VSYTVKAVNFVTLKICRFKFTLVNFEILTKNSKSLIKKTSKKSKLDLRAKVSCVILLHFQVHQTVHRINFS